MWPKKILKLKKIITVKKSKEELCCTGYKGAVKIDGKGLFLDVGNDCKVICFIIYEIIFYVSFLLLFYQKKKVVGERDTCDQWGSYHLLEKKSSSKKKTVNIIEKLEDLKKHFTERENPNSQ